MKAEVIASGHQFMSGGGEMGALTRAMDWSKTAVGDPEHWPQSLRTILNIVLNSRFPMFLWWGPELTCFYNDAYRPSLGQNGKHPYILGQRAEEAWSEIWHVIKPLIDRVMTSGEATYSEDQLIPIYRNGSIEDVYWTFSYSPVYDDAGTVSGVLVVCSETTDKVLAVTSLKGKEQELTRNLEIQASEQSQQIKRSGEELTKRDELYQMMIGEVQDYAILFISREGIVQNWNKGAEKIKGYTAEEIIGQSFSKFYTPEDKARHLPDQLLVEALTTGRAGQEGWRVKKDGSWFWASVVITAIHDQDNNVVGFSKVTRDLTEKKAAEERIKEHAEQLEEKNRELEKMNAELKSFAYVSSHDLQEPLRKIQTFASLIMEKEREALSERGKDYFRRMQDAANRMQTLIEDLLAYSRTNSSQRVFNTVDLGEMLSEVIIDFKDTITTKNATVEVGPMVELTVIKFQFRQLLHNLLGNALKFSKPGVPPYIKINSEIQAGDGSDAMPEAGEQYCHLSIQDNGIGFDPQYKDRIFEVFQRLHGKDEYKGTGIGLAIVRRIVENHNGTITATGEIDKGATFDIYIPVVI